MSPRLHSTDRHQMVLELLAIPGVYVIVHF